jgi:6-phosphogluconolactonase/glucosamine-6-phosphate isomerase/deaminase
MHVRVWNRHTRDQGLARPAVIRKHEIGRNVRFFSPQAAAEADEAELGKFFGLAPPAFDVPLPGPGVEGHVASLFPGLAALVEKQKRVMAVEAPAKVPQRLTLTPAVLNRGDTHFS